MPMASDRPPSDMTFRSMPVKYMIKSATSTLKGIEKATMMVGFQSRRNRAKTTMAKSAPKIKDCRMVLM